ncbi:histidine kinase [Pseudoalteromonas xiamenensis]
MTKQQTLHRFLQVNLLVPFALFGLLWLYIATQFYWSALDETAEYYVVEDAYQFAEIPTRIKTSFRIVSDDLKDFPLEFQKRFKNHALPTDEVQYLSTQGHDFYYLKHHPSKGLEAVYVLHQFAKSDSQDIRPLLLVIMLLSLLCFALWLLGVIQRVRAPLAQFTQNIQQGQENALVKFEEFQSAQNITLAALAIQKQQIEQQKAFASFLSHEVRHPITKLGHQLAQFDHMDELSLETLKQIDALKTTQKETVQLSNTILNLLDVHAPTEERGSSDLVIELFNWGNSTPFPCEIDTQLEHFIVSLNTEDLALLLNQVNTNMQRYGSGCLRVRLNTHELVFENDIKPGRVSSQGFGVGLFIVHAVARKVGWRVESTKVGECFHLTLNFK